MRNRPPFSRLIPLVALLSLILWAGYIKFGRQTLGNNRYTAADGLEINPLGVGYESYCAELNPKGIGPCLAHNLQVIVDLSIACKSEEPCTLDASRLKGRVEGEAGVGKAAAQEYSPSAFFGCYIANLRERGLGAEFILPGQSSLVQVAYQPGVLVDHFGDHKDFVFSLIYENDHQRTAISVPESPATSVFGKPSGRVSQMILTPHWSPDGTRIAFRGYLDGQDGIWLVNADGFDLHPLATNLSDHAPVTWLSWSPDGGQIAYIASEKGSASLCMSGYAHMPPNTA